jgi:hypothetical protein
MKPIPFKHSRQGSLGKLALDYSTINFDCDFVFPILRMEMWRSMIAVVHPNNDSKESTDFRHGSLTCITRGSIELPHVQYA